MFSFDNKNHFAITPNPIKNNYEKVLKNFLLLEKIENYYNVRFKNFKLDNYKSDFLSAHLIVDLYEKKVACVRDPEGIWIDYTGKDIDVLNKIRDRKIDKSLSFIIENFEFNLFGQVITFPTMNIHIQNPKLISNLLNERRVQLNGEDDIICYKL